MSSERISNADDAEQAGIADATFDAADVGRIEICFIGKSLLGKPLLGAVFADVLSKSI